MTLSRRGCCQTFLCPTEMIFVLLMIAYIVLLGLLLPPILDSFGGIGAVIFGIVFTLGWFVVIGIGTNHDQIGKFTLGVFRVGAADGMRFLGIWIASMLALFVGGLVIFLLVSALS